MVEHGPGLFEVSPGRYNHQTGQAVIGLAALTWPGSVIAGRPRSSKGVLILQMRILSGIGVLGFVCLTYVTSSFATVFANMGSELPGLVAGFIAYHRAVFLSLAALSVAALLALLMASPGSGIYKFASRYSAVTPIILFVSMIAVMLAAYSPVLMM